MRLFLTASADNTLYQRIPTVNAGLDEIIEVGKVLHPDDLEFAYTGSSARTIINFKLPVSGTIPETASFYLNLKIANAQKLQYSQQLDIFEISGSSWVEGSGYLYQSNINGPVIRNYSYYVWNKDPKIDTGSLFSSSQTVDSPIKKSNDGSTWNNRNSATSASWTTPGGDYYLNPSQSVNLSEYPLEDLRIDVSSIMQSVITNNRDFRGLIIKFSSWIGSRRK